MRIGIPAEALAGETRVALAPSAIPALIKKKHEVIVESDAGLASGFADADYEKAGAVVVKTRQEVYNAAGIVFKVQAPAVDPTTGVCEAEMLVEGTALIGFLAPLANVEMVRVLARRKITSFSMEFIPRITRAQSMDALSSMATLAGYKAVLIAAKHLPRIFPYLITAAGSIPPATVLVLGAGVAGLQAIATAKRLGARVEAFDPRPVVKEQVESLGAVFVAMETVEDAQTAGGYAKEQSEEFLKREQETIAARLPKCDVVVTTAQVFGKKAPLLITADMVKLMPRGSIIVDLAAEQGGNCELTKANQMIEEGGVTVYGAVNLPATLPVNASQMYSKNVSTLFDHLYKDPEKGLDFEDEITRSSCLTHAGEIRNDLARQAAG
ncbi:MAG: Re/Si-specific NAD(P)(+) transhydrogenase subunit alpha [Candidatus Hydrogenedentes bacterium]|nr:Re/Si-specific NAD(P)(+) transhydrogenase subunit alpha [Candidatus Hydrogenedentota bacterium]